MEKTVIDYLQILKKCKINIGKERDKLRKAYDDLSYLLDNTEQGLEDLDSAIDLFSEYC